MSAALITRLRKQRELKVVVAGMTFIARRPTDVEMVAISRAGIDVSEIAARHVIGWDGVTENAIAGGGGSAVVPFDAELWREWLADRPDFWLPIGNAVLEAYGLHQRQMDDAAKK